MIAIAVAAFVAIFFFHVPFPLIILAAGVIGFVGGRAGSPLFRIGGGHGKESASDFADKDSALGEETPEHAQPNRRWSLQVSAILLALWLGPVALLVVALGSDNVFSKIAIFFSEMAMVTFGGAYAVLSYVAQQAVQHYGWLRPGEMLDGLGMAETTPGPLIMVTQFVGFMGAYRSPDGLNPMLAATLGAILTTWVTFVPCFLWIFLGAPFIERLRANVALTGAMSAITAAVVGVIMNLAIWFALHVLFRETAIWEGYGMRIDIPVWDTINLPSFGLTLAALLAIFRLQLPMLVVLLAAALAGIAGVLLGGTA